MPHLLHLCIIDNVLHQEPFDPIPPSIMFCPPTRGANRYRVAVFKKKKKIMNSGRNYLFTVINTTVILSPWRTVTWVGKFEQQKTAQWIMCFRKHLSQAVSVLLRNQSLNVFYSMWLAQPITDFVSLSATSGLSIFVASQSQASQWFQIFMTVRGRTRARQCKSDRHLSDSLQW